MNDQFRVKEMDSNSITFEKMRSDTVSEDRFYIGRCKRCEIEVSLMAKQCENPEVHKELDLPCPICHASLQLNKVTEEEFLRFRQEADESTKEPLAVPDPLGEEK